MLRASWYIKVIYLNRKEKDIDPQSHWTETLLSFIAAQIKEMIASNKAAYTKAYQAYDYVVKLINWNYSEGLLDSDKFFGRLLQMLNDSSKLDELCLVISILVDYLSDICRVSKTIVRQLANIAVEKLNQVKLKYMDLINCCSDQHNVGIQSKIYFTTRRSNHASE